MNGLWKVITAFVICLGLLTSAAWVHATTQGKVAQHQSDIAKLQDCHEALRDELANVHRKLDRLIFLVEEQRLAAKREGATP